MLRTTVTRIRPRIAVIALALVMSLVAGCASGPAPVAGSPRPAWIDDPGDGAVGSSTTHVKGRHYQQELAIERAREKLAARLGVTVSSVQTVEEKVANSSASVVAKRNTVSIIENKTVRARVKETWYDSARDTFWVLVVPEN